MEHPLCDVVSEILLEESIIQPISTPVTVCGDIYGQFYDLQQLFRTGGQVGDTNYLYMYIFLMRCQLYISLFQWLSV